MVLAERAILSVQAEGQGSCFLFATIHLESPIGPKSPLRTFFEEQRRVQAQQVWLIMALTAASTAPIGLLDVPKPAPPWYRWHTCKFMPMLNLGSKINFLQCACSAASGASWHS